MKSRNITGIRRIGKATSRFAQDYMRRHRHPVNAALHIVGVPAAFYGFWLIGSSMLGKGSKLNKKGSEADSSNLALGIVLVFFGYLFQYLGHRKQGNEVGEVTLIKNISRRFELGNLQAKVWTLFGGGAPGARPSSAKLSSTASPAKESRKLNGNGSSSSVNSSPFTSHSLVWWKRP